MAIEIKVSDIRADEAEITEILVRMGDKVEVEQSLITVEGDKVSMETLSPQAGVVEEIKVSAGDKTETSKLTTAFGPIEGAAATALVQEKKGKAAPTTTASAATMAAKEVHVPDIGGDEVEIAEVMVKVGDIIIVEQSLIIVEGGKASMEVSAPFVSTVREIRINIGDKASIGSLIMIFEMAGVTPVAAPAQAITPMATIPAAADSVKDANVPDIGDDEVEVTEVMIEVGDKVVAEQSLITVEDDKTSMEVPAPFAGVVKEIKIGTDDRVKIGSLIMVFKVEGAASVAVPAQVATPAPAAAPIQIAKPAVAPAVGVEGKTELAENDAHVHATPLVHRLARESGVNPAGMKETGRKGRTPCEDVQIYVEDAIKRTESASVATVGGGIPGMLPWPKVDFNKFGEAGKVELGRIQKIPGASLSRNWVMIPHVIHFDKADIIDLGTSRRQQNVEAEKRKLDVKFIPVVFIMKVVAITLKQMLRSNSSLSEDDQRLTLKKYINIGVAMDTLNGLVVPAFKDVSKKSITELSRELTTISKRTRDGKLTAGEVQGGCFTVPSIGGLGTTHFASITNAPEVAILGTSKSVMEPIWDGKEFVPCLMMPTSLSFDHHVTNGTNGVCFTTIINNILSNIRRLVV